MFGSVVLDVAIGMVFVYLLLSLIASVVQEIIASYLQLRATNLLRGVRSLFSGCTVLGHDMTEALYDHGLIRGLYYDPVDDQHPKGPKAQEMELAKGRSRTSSDGESWQGRLRKFVGFEARVIVNAVSNKARLPGYIPSRTFALAMIDLLNTDKVDRPNVMKTITNKLAAYQAGSGRNKACEALLALAIDANNDVATFEKNLDHWYNDSMDRASGWYKRYIQRILLCIGLLLAVTFNVDSVRVVRTLWSDRETRQAMVSAASEYVREHPDPPKPVAAQAPTPASSQTADTASSETPPKTDPVGHEDELERKLQDSASAFNNVTNRVLLPVGWRRSPIQYVKAGWSYLWLDPKPDGWWENVEDTVWRCFALLLGWVVTGVAISLGAPFWFDMLNKIMVVRSTIKPQEKSQIEGSKDKAPSTPTPAQPNA